MRMYEVQERIGMGLVVLAACFVVTAACVVREIRIGMVATLAIFGGAYLIGWAITSAIAAWNRRTPDGGK